MMSLKRINSLKLPFMEDLGNNRTEVYCLRPGPKTRAFKNQVRPWCSPVDCQPANQKVASLISSEGTSLGCRPHPQLGACKRQPINASIAYGCFSPSLSPFHLLSLKINKKKLKKTKPDWYKTGWRNSELSPDYPNGNHEEQGDHLPFVVVK